MKRSPAMWAEIRGGQDGFRAVGAWDTQALGVPRKDLAVRFNIDAASITQIVKRTSYRWVS